MKRWFGRITPESRREELIADFIKHARQNRVKQMEMECAALRAALDTAHYRELAEHYERQAEHLQAQIPGHAQRLADAALTDIIATAHH